MQPTDIKGLEEWEEIRSSTEDDLDFIDKCKDLRGSLTWQEFADICNCFVDIPHSESWYRKHYKSLKTSSKANPDKSKEEIIEEYKEKYKLLDIQNQARNDIRRLSREDSIKEIAHDFAMQMSDKKILPVYKTAPIEEQIKFGTLLISDWHVGIEIDNYFNRYNVDIAKERVAKLLEKTIKWIKFYDIKKLNVLNLGDLIAGRIHYTIRLQSRIDVIEQTMIVSEILAEFLTDLSKHVEIDYYDCVDNHSRVEPNKKEALNLETFCRIITWYLLERLKDNENITIHPNNEYGEDIISFCEMGYNIAGVHGDKDRPSEIINNVSRLTQTPYDLIVSAHLHHLFTNEDNYTNLVSNGSLMGTDVYAKDLRKSSPPSQTFIYSTEENIVEGIHKILVD